MSAKMTYEYQFYLPYHWSAKTGGEWYLTPINTSTPELYTRQTVQKDFDFFYQDPSATPEFKDQLKIRVRAVIKVESAWEDYYGQDT